MSYKSFSSLLIGDEAELREFRDLVEVERKNVTEELDKLAAHSNSLRLAKCDDPVSTTHRCLY